MRFDRLTPTEQRVLEAYISAPVGLAKVVAEELGRSKRTIETHRRQIVGKLDKNFLRIFYEMGRRDALCGKLHVRVVRQGVNDGERSVLPEERDLTCQA